ncbi:ATP-binding protein [Synechocystis sp. FACHB-383]|uniref:ATP-binding protein n=1 Tax=Synechocystis sp. FACHB-383 TaxID=2692864 RepID=UPI001681EBEE|nr:ATP-binding protein [Synechocystis sp. FACHB-383]MBD2655360.1 ATP-binding protein [Synechocystis sp. FACHB-383]
MKIKSVTISCFRGYATSVKVEVNNLCVLVGKNDIGKSTILEALDIFFNENKGCVKLDKDDINKQCITEGKDCIEIAVEFIDLPEFVLIDETNKTTLANEYLLTETGTLMVLKRYPKAGKEKVFIRALHPTHENCRDLLQKKNPDLKKLLDEQALECSDKTKNAELRKAIWQGQDDLRLEEQDIEVTKIDTKSIWEQLKGYMPLYILFQSDRKNSDGDSEVQDPMRLAVREILDDPIIKDKLSSIAETVKERLNEVADRTLNKLREMNPSIANSLNPQLPDAAALKWIDVFKNVAISGDEDIPINKRGSGVKRLVLISFFRAEAEKRQLEVNLPHIIYSIEEPETSQHPEHQRALIDALVSLASAENTQVFITTHSPAIVKRLQFENILLISGRSSDEILHVREHNLPYPSLNEVNYAAFDEASYEYHNELYGYIEAERVLSVYKEGKPTRSYNKINRNGSISQEEIILTEYIRHQIHHLENNHNELFTVEELKDSINMMRDFITTRLHNLD